MSFLSRIVLPVLVLALLEQAVSAQLPSAQPNATGISIERLSRMDAVIQASIEKKELPGALLTPSARLL
jgi:hypothetical protein